MRDPERIPRFVEKLKKYWFEQIPDWRFGQFMCNFLGYAYEQTKTDVFFIEEDEMEKLLEKYFCKNCENN